jgi:hypothetical protein
MRMAIQPKFAREGSIEFWRKANQLFASNCNVRKAALQKWFPVPASAAEVFDEQQQQQHHQQQQQQAHRQQQLPEQQQQEEVLDKDERLKTEAETMKKAEEEMLRQQQQRIDAVKRFSYIFDRHSATKNFRALKYPPASAADATDGVENLGGDGIVGAACVSQNSERVEVTAAYSMDSDDMPHAAAEIDDSAFAGSGGVSAKRQRKQME